MKVVPKENGPVEEIRSWSPWRTVLITAAVLFVGAQLGLSTVVIILALIVMIFMHELGHYLTAKAAGMKVTEFFIGFGPRLWSFERGETEYGLKAIPAGAYVRIIGMSNLEEIDPAEEDRTYRSKPYWRRLSVAVAGSTMHFIMAGLLIYTVFAGLGVPDEHSPNWTIGSITKPSAASNAGLQLGDRVERVDGRQFAEFKAMSDYLRAHPGAHVELQVSRDGREIALEADLARRNPNTGERVGFLGVGPTFAIERIGPVAAIGRSVTEVREVAKMSVLGLAHIFSPTGVEGYVDNIVHPGEHKTTIDEVDTNRPTSVVGIVQIGSQVAREGWINVLYLLFAVNIFIGLFNMIPTLPFDGGHVAIATYEKVRSMISGRRYQADVAKLLPLTYVVVAALALLFVTSIYLDIAHPVSVR